MRRRFILATLGTTALLATGPTAMAGKPEIQTIPVDFVDTIDCGGFALEGHVFGTIKSRFTESRTARRAISRPSGCVTS